MQVPFGNRSSRKQPEQLLEVMKLKPSVCVHELVTARLKLFVMDASREVAGGQQAPRGNQQPARVAHALPERACPFSRHFAPL
jgi:hypothetical protein